MSEMLRVGVFGASGRMGQELVNIIEAHQEMSLALEVSTSKARVAVVGFPAGGSDRKTIEVRILNTSGTAVSLERDDRINIMIVCRNTSDGAVG